MCFAEDEEGIPITLQRGYVIRITDVEYCISLISGTFMDNYQNEFELDYKGEKIQVHRHSIGAQVVFRVLFSNKKAPLVITRAKHSNAHKFWTSIPEGRQKEAEEIGALISEYFNSIV